MKSLIIAAALVAFVCAHERSGNVRDHSDLTEAEIAEKRANWNALTDEERQEKVEKSRARASQKNEIPAEVRQRIHEKFESLSPEKRQELKEKIVKGRENFAKKSDEEKKEFHEKFQAIHARMSALPEAERQEEIQKLRKEHGPPAFVKDIPIEIRQQMRAKFESLSPEERQNLINRVHRQRFPDAAFNQAEALPVAVNHQMSQLSEEDKQKIRQKFESLTLEQRNEIRNRIESRPRPERNQSQDGRPQGDFQRIRSVDDDRMMRGDWNRDMSANRRKQE